MNNAVHFGPVQIWRAAQTMDEVHAAMQMTLTGAES
jgi:hypothetical protein